MLPLRILLHEDCSRLLFYFLVVVFGGFACDTPKFLLYRDSYEGRRETNSLSIRSGWMFRESERMSLIIVRVLTRLATSCLAANRQSSVHSVAPSHEERKLHSEMVRPLLLNNPVCK